MLHFRTIISRPMMIQFVAAFALLLNTSCEKDPIVFDTIYPTDRQEVEQYGEPFSNVPSTEDIIMYEANIGAMSASGDFAGVEAKLDHIQLLGVNVLWLMPIHSIGVEKGSGSPYAVKDYKSIASRFGDLNDLRNLVEEAHARDIAVILDWVGNHTAWDNAWIANKSWYTQDASGNIISPREDWPDVADLNFGNNSMREEMIDAMKYWVLEANIDGFRCDYAEGVPNDFWKEAISRLKTIPGRNLVFFAESADKTLLDNGFDMIFGWDFYHAAEKVYAENQSAGGIITAHNDDYSAMPDGTHMVRWITNHDDNAWDDTPQNIFGGLGASVSAFAVTALTGGVPLIYSGQEVGTASQLGFFENSTEKIDWSANPTVLADYQAILGFRSGSEVLRKGDLATYGADQDVVLFTRELDGAMVMVMVNTRNSSKTFTVPDALQGNWTDALSESTQTIGTTIDIDGFAYKIFTK